MADHAGAAGPDGRPQRHEVGSGERVPTGHTAATLGLSLEEGNAVLAAVQRHLVAAQVAALLRGLETYVSGQADLIIDYATARRSDEPISTATTEGTVQWLLHRRMGASQQMRWRDRAEPGECGGSAPAGLRQCHAAAER